MKLIRFILLFCLLLPRLQAQVIQRQGKDKAVFFAVSDYDEGTGWRDLDFPIQEAEGLAKILREDFGFETEVIPDPTRQEVLTKLAELGDESYASDAQLLLFFTGHGSTKGKDGYFITKEITVRNQFWSAVAYSQLKNMVANLPCQHTLLMIDACYSGSLFIGEKGDLGDGPKWTGTQAEIQNQHITSTLGKENYHYAFTSSAANKKTPDESSFAANFKNGLLKVRKEGLAYTSISKIWHRDLVNALPMPIHGKYANKHLAISDFYFFFQATSEIKIKKRTGKLRLMNHWEDGALYINGDYKGQMAVGEADFNLAVGYHQVEIRQQGKQVWQSESFYMDKEELKLLATSIPPISKELPVLNKEVFSNGNTKKDLPSAPEMVFIEGGTFTMGCTAEQKGCDDDEKPVHQVSLGNYWMGKTEVTNEEFCVFLNSYGSDEVLSGKYKGQKIVEEYRWGVKKVGTRWETQQGYENHPIIYVSWYGAVTYASWLSEKTGQTYRLPTEAEWEYAARGGNLSKGYQYAGGDEANRIAWYDQNSYDKGAEHADYGTHQVGLKAPNELGLYDMSGNVWEWCHDWYGNYTVDSKVNPTGATTGDYRVIRGGCWYDYPRSLRVALRLNRLPESRSDGVGFRLCLPQL